MRLWVFLVWLLTGLPAMAQGLTMSDVGTAAGGAAGAPFAAWDTTVNPTCFNFTNGNLTATFNGACSEVATQSTTSYGLTATAKVYFELTPVFSTGTNSPGNIFIGFADAATLSGGTVGGAGGVGYQTNGALFIGSPGTGTIAAMVSGTVVAFAADFTARKVWMKVGCAGLWNNHVHSGTEDPATGVGGYGINNGTDWNPAGPLFIGFSDGFNGQLNAMTLNDGSTAFSCTAPTGYVRW